MVPLVSLELPFSVGPSVASCVKTFKMFGGSAAFSAIFHTSKEEGCTKLNLEESLLLELVPDEDMSPVVGDICPVSRPRIIIALHINKRTKRVIDGRLIGKVKRRGHFWDAIADYRVLESDTMKETLPVRYSRIFWSKELKGTNDSYQYGTWAEPRSGRVNATATIRVRHGESAPSGPSQAALMIISSIDARSNHFLSVLRDLFRRRAVWRRRALADHLRALSEPSIHKLLTSTELSALLPVIAYELVSGPWRRTWVRFGYDINSDSKSRFLQVIDIRSPSQHTSKHSPTSTITLQLCDLVASRVAQDAVLGAPRFRSCDSSHGWFAPKFLDGTVCPLIRDDFKKEKINLNPNKEDGLSWREFLDVAAVTDLTVRILDMPPGRPNKRRKEVSKAGM